MSFFDRLQRFSILTVCFVVTVFFFKLCETAIGFNSVTSFSGFVYGNLIACGFIAAVVFVLYLLISLLSEKTALYFSATLLGIMLFTEVGLSVYHFMTGILMGKELVVRPLWEMLHTIKSAVSIWLITAVVILLVVYVVLSVKLARKTIKNWLAYIVFVFMVVSIPLFFTISVSQDKVIVNKTMYCARACMKGQEMFADMEFDLMKTEYNADVVEKFMEMFPERQVLDERYPLERNDNIENVLGPYFKKSDMKPNIVIIIVESLGADLFGENATGACYTPFLDSLAKHSLVWPNCMSTTPRSFGAVPAITASVPHGLKGFQFGNIPNHNSLISILSNNGYSTNAFYAGNFSFDRIYNYLVMQRIDYMSPFYEEYKNDESQKKDGTHWGYNDDVMFKKSLEIIENRDNSKPALDLFVTITQHEDLKLVDKKLEKMYYDMAESLHPSANWLGKMASTLYTDDALRHFVNDYIKYDNQGNTIFIITGDHSMNITDNNPLDAYHVPLIIWSPLLEQTARFEAMVSHNDITPSILALLHENFGIATPETVSWVSEGLDTVTGFHSNIKNYFLHYSRELEDFIWGDYYYNMKNKSHPLAHVTAGVNLEFVDDDEKTADMSEKFRTMVYVDNYAYSNDKIVKNPILTENSFEVFKMVRIDSVYCASGHEKPSVSTPKPVVIYDKKFNGDYKEIKLVLTADIKYTGNVWQNKFISMIVECTGNKMETIYSSDYIAKFIMDRYPQKDTWQKLELTNVFVMNNSDKFEIKIYMLPTDSDKKWVADHTVLLKNISINLLKSDN